MSKHYILLYKHFPKITAPPHTKKKNYFEGSNRVDFFEFFGVENLGLQSEEIFYSVYLVVIGWLRWCDTPCMIGLHHYDYFLPIRNTFHEPNLILPNRILQKNLKSMLKFGVCPNNQQQRNSCFMVINYLYYHLAVIYIKVQQKSSKNCARVSTIKKYLFVFDHI